MALIKNTYRVAVCDDCVQGDAGISEEERGRPYVYAPMGHWAGLDHTLTVDLDDAHFSGRACDGCGEQLAGDRFDGTVAVWA